MTNILKKCVLIIILLLFVVIFVGIAVYEYIIKINGVSPIVTEMGLVQGETSDDGEYQMYLGIPYGEVDVNNVFGKLLPPKNFSKVFKASKNTYFCPQYDKLNNKTLGTLDCLRLNVFVPLKSKQQSFSVLIFFAGTRFTAEVHKKTYFGPKYLMKYDIIVVTVNYRVGPYGFLCVDDLALGNQGLKDQVSALKWVQQNIKSFGGDPNKVTIAGSDNDGEYVNLHLLYGKEKLFQRVIIDSGIHKQPYELNKTVSARLELAKNLGCDTDDVHDAIGFLNEQKADAVIEISHKLGFKYRPCIEKENDETFITNKSLKVDFKSIKSIPILITHAENEMAILHLNENYKSNNIRLLIHDTLKRQFNLHEDDQKNMEYYVRKYYVDNEFDEDKVLDGLINFSSDILSNYPTKRMIDKYLENDAKVFYGIFSYSGGRNYMRKIFNVTVDGAISGDMMGYLWDLPFARNNLTESEDEVIIDRVSSMWANFVKYGDPTPSLPQNMPNKWKPAVKGKLNPMDISTMKHQDTAFQNRTAFWDLFFSRHGGLEIKEDLEPWI